MNKTLSYLCLLLAQLMVGVCVSGSKFLVAEVSPVAILNVRFMIATAMIFAAHFLFGRGSIRDIKKVGAREWLFMIAQGICAGALFNILLLYGLMHTSASIAGIITSTLPALVAIMSVIFLRERLSRMTIFCIFFSVLGLIIINASNLLHLDKSNLYGDFIILIALIPEAGYYVMSKMYDNRLSVLLISGILNGINIPIFLSFMWYFNYPMMSPALVEHFPVLLMVSMGSALFYIFWFSGYKQVTGTAAGLSTAFMPISTLLIATLFLGESITPLQFIGMCLVLAAIIVNAVKMSRPPREVVMVDP